MTVQLIENEQSQAAIDRYHRILYSLHEDDYPHWMGVLIRKNPLDLWMYAELIHRVKPDVIIELGTAKGGSALFFSAMQHLVKDGLVITIDQNETPECLEDELVSDMLPIRGMTQDAEVVAEVRGIVKIRNEPIVMLSHDAGHLTYQVLADLELYAPLVTPGSYCVVEDTNIEGNPIGHEGVMGPGKAVAQFLEDNDGWEVDRKCERFGLTFNPGGWLRRI